MRFSLGWSMMILVCGLSWAGATSESQPKPDGKSDDNAQAWVQLAETMCIPTFSYTVEVTTERAGTIAGNEAKPDGMRTRASFTFSQEKGLKHTDRHGGASFVVDIARLLQKMKGSADWVLESPQTNVGGVACVIVKSSGANWAVELAIDRQAGVVKQCDHHMNGKHISTCLIDYDFASGPPFLPSKTTTTLHLTGEIVTQTYEDYSIK